MIEKKVRVLSFGAGTQSSALLLGYLNGDIPNPPDFAVFADTGAEPQSVYSWMKKLKNLADGKMKIIIASEGNLEKDTLSKDRSASIPFFIKNQDGSQGMLWRQCTTDYKVKAVRNAIRNELGYKPGQRVKEQVTVLIGISTDEASRMKDNPTRWMTNEWPLIDMDWTRNDCIEYVEKTGVGTPPKSACYFCPYRSSDEWRQLKNNDPKAFEQAVNFERDLQSANNYNGIPFIHRSMVPLNEIDFTNYFEQLDLFENDCEGMCGL